MGSRNSDSILDALREHFGCNVAAEPEGEFLRITLPGNTLDEHLVTVYARPLTVDYWEVQDAASATADLFCQGVHLTPLRRARLRQIAERLRVTFEDDVFKAVCREEELAFYAWRVRDAVALASTLLLEHRFVRPRIEVRRYVRMALSALQAKGFQVRERAETRGEHAIHRVDFEIRPEREGVAAAVQTLSPGNSPWLRAEAYAFMVTDLDHQYRHVAVLQDPEFWTRKAVNLLHSVGARVVEAREPASAGQQTREVVEEVLGQRSESPRP
jgi:hypothetical protein